MKVLLDENLPHDLRHHLVGHEVFTVTFMQWSGMKNGVLLRRAADAGFEVMLTMDEALNVGKLRRTIVSDLWRTTSGAASLDISSDWGKGNYTAGSRMTRLDLVGRNHGSGSHPADEKTNFLYLDGHVETKSIVETMPPDANSTTPWEWSAAAYMYSLSGN